ncbi:MAG: hypothetical protein HZB81_03405 [Deltaproteobacteria bacterium]|nr:hypothetical protein [Deltaproteobacteria bacterium]
MKLTKQNWLYLIVGCLIGVIIGGVISLHITDNASRKTFKLYLESGLFWEEGEAIKRFREGYPEVAIYAQDRLILYATRLKEMEFTDEKNLSRLIGFAEGRNGVLYESIGETSKAEKHLKNAIESLKKANIIIGVNELRSLIISSKKENK